MASKETNPDVELSAVIVGIAADEPQVLVVRPEGGPLEGLPSGPLESEHRTLGAGLRSWVERQTGQLLGYVEQLYTFGDRNRTRQGRTLSIGYLALVRELKPARHAGAAWRSAYRYFPWEDWRAGRPAVLSMIDTQLRRWIAASGSTFERRAREERARATFATGGRPWNEERVLERYELLYEIGLVSEAHRDRVRTWGKAEDALPEGISMYADHRRVLATALARLRGKIKYRPVVFELMPPTFTFLQLQRAVEALAGLQLHKPNFRRLVESQHLVEDTGKLSAETAGRPARLLRYRREVVPELPAPVARLPVSGVKAI
ncbi:MAG: NUDIX hydrolase [Burkholderiales bacterium]